MSAQAGFRGINNVCHIVNCNTGLSAACSSAALVRQTYQLYGDSSASSNMPTHLNIPTVNSVCILDFCVCV